MPPTFLPSLASLVAACCLVTLLLVAQEPGTEPPSTGPSPTDTSTFEVDRPAPEMRLSIAQAQTPVRRAEPSSLTEVPTRSAPEMRLLAQVSQPSPDSASDLPELPPIPLPPELPAPQVPAMDEPGATQVPGGFGPPGTGRRGPPGGGFGTLPGGFAPAGEDETIIFEGDRVLLQFPNNPVADLLNIYERLTGMTLIKDTNIFEGATISLVTPTAVERIEAIRLIEASLLTNGYAIVLDTGGKSARILPARSREAGAVQFSHGVTFYQAASEIPMGETLVTFFMQLENLEPQEAANILANHVGLSVYGRMTPVVTPPGLLVTESATIVRQLVGIRDAIDIASSASSLITKFIPIEHADAAIIAQIVQATVNAQAQEQETKGVVTLRGEIPPDLSTKTPAPSGSSSSSSRTTTTTTSSQQSRGQAAATPSLSAQVVADSRLNQVLVVASPSDYTYIASLISEFDKPLDVVEPYERELRFASAVDLLPALVDVLQEAISGTTQLPGGGSLAGQTGGVQASTSSQLLGGVTGGTTRGGQITTTSGAATDTAAGGTSSLGSRPDLIQGPTEDNAPISVLVGKTRIVADPMANAILVIGRKENIAKVDGMIDKLDRRPAQVYLATVIGQLTLGDGMQSGVDYLTRFRSSQSDFGGTGSLLVSRDNIITGNVISDLRDNLLTSSFGPAAGLNIYGAIGDSLDVFVTALETSNQFRVLSRPTVFALNNKKAVITSGQLIPVPVQSTTFIGQGAGNQGNVTTNIEYRDVVLKLEVVPLVNADGEVNLTIAQVNDTVVGQQRVEPNDIPIIGTEQLVTSVTVPDGKTVVLGGLISEEQKHDTQGMPYISRLPLLGKLFREDIESTVRRELIIFIQPRVVKDNNSMLDASRSEDYRTEIGAAAAQRFPQEVDISGSGNPAGAGAAEDRKGFFSRMFKRQSRAPFPTTR